nr:hypothetical protein [uncultured Campylobacter sp.]
MRNKRGALRAEIFSRWMNTPSITAPIVPSPVYRTYASATLMYLKAS